MSDDDYNEAQAIGGAITVGAVRPIVAMSLAGNASAFSKPDDKELAKYTGEVISPAEMKTWSEWADKVPALIRAQMKNVPDDAGQGISPGKIMEIGVGAIVGIATLTKHIPGLWKLLSGGVAGGLIAHGLLDKSVGSPFPEAKSNILAYADTLERDANLRRQLADYLAIHMTGDYVASRSLEEAVAGKAMEFGRSAPYLGMDAVGTNTSRELQRAGHSDCKCKSL